MTGNTPWPGLPDSLSFDAFDDEDQILDFINSLEPTARRILFDALDKSTGEDIVAYARTTLPVVHMVLMKFTAKNNGGLVLLLSRSTNHIYSHFERLKEQTPDHVQYLDGMLTIISEQIRVADELEKKQ